MTAPWDYETLVENAHPSIRYAELSVRATRCLLQWRPDISVEDLAHMPDLKERLYKVKGMGRRTVNEVLELVENYRHPDLFVRARILEEEPKELEYARRQAEALEKIEAALVEIVVGLRKQAAPVRLSADDIWDLRGR